MGNTLLVFFRITPPYFPSVCHDLTLLFPSNTFPGTLSPPSPPFQARHLQDGRQRPPRLPQQVRYEYHRHRLRANVRPRKMPRRDIHGCCPFPRPRDGLLSLPRGKIRCHDWPNHQRVLRAVRRWVLLPRRRNRQAWREVPRWCVEETVLGELREIRERG